MSEICGYCAKEVAGDAFNCRQCSACVHVWCLKELPERGFLLGDVFFDFTCDSCGEEEIKRRKLQWIMIVIITLHNLSHQSPGLANHEHFHFRTHITSFIDKHWENFFPNEARRKRKNLLGTIAGVLSQHSPDVFSSGTSEIGTIGWWKLSRKWKPIEFEKFLQNRLKRPPENEPRVAEKRLKVNGDNRCSIETDGFSKHLEESDNEEETKGNSLDPNTEESDCCAKEFALQALNESELINLIPGDEQSELPLVRNEFHESEEILDIEGLRSHPVVPSSMDNKLESSSDASTHNSNQKMIQSQPKFLDRYRSVSKWNYQSLVVGPSSNERFHSPLTGRILHPFIYRDRKILPRWVKLMSEIKFAARKRAPERSPIDFCYMRPHHLPAVNSLLQRTFWPGIDMSDSLSYPDFTVVALYKKLLIGCAFLVPDACHNEAYISFLAVRQDWDRCGIASFMLYHLTQTSHGKDITLHVSASNPAICLYQKFGFKTEELVLGFYEKYLPPDSPHSPHALFLRLAR